MLFLTKATLKERGKKYMRKMFSQKQIETMIDGKVVDKELVSYDGENFKDADGNTIEVGGSTQLYMHFVQIEDENSNIGHYTIVNTSNENINSAYLYGLLMSSGNVVNFYGASYDTSIGEIAKLFYFEKDEVFKQTIGTFTGEVTTITDVVKQL